MRYAIRVSRAFVVALALFGSQAFAQTGTMNDFPASLVPSNLNGPQPAVWRTVPTPAQIAAVFPNGATKSGYMLWQCHVLVDGRLNGCALETQWPPKDDRYEAAAKSLLPLFRTDAKTARLAHDQDKQLLFSLPIYRPGSQSFTAKECPPPFCVPVLPPPKP